MNNNSKSLRIPPEEQMASKSKQTIDTADFKRSVPHRPFCHWDEARVFADFGSALLRAGSLRHAADFYRKAIELRRDWAEIHAMLGVSLHASGQVDKAIESYRQAIELKTNYVQACEHSSIVLLELKRSSETIETLQSVINTDPFFPEVHANLGVILARQGKMDEALIALRKAIELKPGYAEAHANLGACLQILGQMEEAAACLQAAIACKPSYGEAHANLGIVMYALGRHADAAEAFHTAMMLGIEIAAVFLRATGAPKDSHEPNASVEAHRLAANTEPDVSETYSKLSIALLEQAQHEAAIVILRKAIALNSTHPHGPLNLQVALHRQGDDDAQWHRKKQRPDYPSK